MELRTELDILRELRILLRRVHSRTAGRRDVARGLLKAIKTLKARSGAISSVARRDSRRGRILLAEDDAVASAVIEHRLENAGHTVFRCGDGHLVPSRAIEEKADLLLIEARLPGVSGFELLRQIRSSHELAGIPVIILAWPGNEQEAVRAFELGADDFVLKPFSPVELTARVGRLLHRSFASRA